MRPGKGIAGMRRVASHKFEAHYYTAAFNGLFGLATENIVSLFQLDVVTSYVGCVKCNKGMRAVSFINHVRAVAVTVFLKKTKNGWINHLVEVKFGNVKTVYYKWTYVHGEGSEYRLLTKEYSQGG